MEFHSIWGSGMDASRYADKPWWFQCACAAVFPTRKSEQMIMTSRYDVMRISLAVEGGKYKRRAHMILGATVVWVFWYTVFGSISKPQTLYFGCLSTSLGTSIIRMDRVTCLSICMYPDLSGELLVSVTLVV